MRHRLVRACLAALLAAGWGRGQVSPMRSPSPRLAEPGSADPLAEDVAAMDRPERKQPSFWHRPSATNAAAQLARGRAFEQRGALRDATSAYLALVHAWHNATEAPDAQWGAARTFEARRRYVRAFEEYRYLLAFFGERVPSGEVLARQMAIANHLREGHSRDRARGMYEEIARAAPHWSGTPEALLRAGALYEDDGENEQAALVYERLLSQAGQSPEAAAAAFRAAACRYRLARRYERDEAACARALSALSLALRDYPDRPERDTAAQQLTELKNVRAQRQFEAAAFYERVRRDPQAAAAAYREFLRRFPDSAQAEAARDRLAALSPDGAAP
jgi:tetratricopeptide (TPR) repeat protein